MHIYLSSSKGNCGASSNRIEYIREMQKYASIDIFGRCGKILPTHYKNGTNGVGAKIIMDENMFYLSFENSFCTDYISEKFFKVLKHDIIPVVRGAGHYDYYVVYSCSQSN
jgi:hypothetical protein